MTVIPFNQERFPERDARTIAARAYTAGAISVTRQTTDDGQPYMSIEWRGDTFYGIERGRDGTWALYDDEGCGLAQSRDLETILAALN